MNCILRLPQRLGCLARLSFKWGYMNADFGVQAARSLGSLPTVAPKGAERIDAKRVMDVSIALGMILFLAPLLLVIVTLIWLETGGSVLFLQRRTGINCQEFRIFKFRSMHVVEDGASVTQAKRGDARVTRVGAFLRRSSLDELPQLFNVLLGDMSLVGPRPHAVAHDHHYGSMIPAYFDRFRVRPGITGLAQVQGLRGEIHEISQMEERVRYDNLYADERSVAMDMKILFRTLRVVAFQTTAY